MPSVENVRMNGSAPSTNGPAAHDHPFPGPSHTRPSLLPKLALKPWIPAAPAGLILTNAQVVDPAAGKLLDGLQSVVVKNGKIAAVYPVDEPDLLEEEAGLRKVDLDGRYICPGLIDAHVHVTAVPGVKTISELVRTPEEDIHYRTIYILREMLLRGFTTVRDTGGASKRLANAIDEGLVVGPRLFQCGKAISQTGGHGDFTPAQSGGEPGCCGGHSISLGRTADGVPQVLKAVREELKAGADQIKVMCGGGVASATDAIETIQYSAEEIQAITTTCRQMGNIHTTAHAYTVEAIRHAIDNGIKGIEHGNLIDKETAIYMAEKGIYLTPTLSCYGIMVRPPFEDFLPPDGQVKNKQVMQQGLQALKLAEEAGVTVCYGSDLLTSMHALQTEEFTVRAEILSSPAILRHATTNPAKLLRREGQIGTVNPGAFADLLVLDANPLEDIRVLDRPEHHLQVVMKEGRVHFSTMATLPTQEELEKEESTKTASSVNGISTGPVASTSTAGLQQSTEQLLETSSRRQKHMCVIAIKGQPCRACAARSRPCTFLDPPTARVRKPKTDGDATGTGTSSPRLPEGALPTQASRPSSSTAVLSQIRAALLPPPLPPGSTSDELLSSTNGAAELNYVNSHAFSSQSFSKEQFHSSGWPGDVAFRQVSSDDAFPVHFVQVPTLMYGTAAPESSRVWQGACAALAPDAPPRLIEIYLKRSQPANPILDETKFTTSDPASLAEAGVSYGLLTSLLAHSTCYVHEIRPVHKYLWRQVLLCLEDEYRRPSLYTMQLALVTITARPAINVAQTHISLGRLVAAAHLLGLHLDPSKWRLPYSERVLRKRLWWSILQQDKWRALWYGRPSMRVLASPLRWSVPLTFPTARSIAREDWNVPLPTVEELPPGSSRVQQLSMHSFVAMCRLTEIVDTILSSFLTVRALSSSRSSTETLKLLEKISLELVALENDLPTELHRLPTAEDRPEVTVATGIRSFQLCKLGIDLTLYQLSSTSVQPTTTADSLASCRTALTLAQTLVEFLENLASGDLEMWWAPYCSFIIATAASVLLRTALSAKDLDATTRTAAGVFFARLVVTLTSSHHASHWDVASLALDKIATLLRSLNGALPELVPLLQLFGPPNHANAGPPAPPQPPPPPPVPISPSLTQLSPALPHPFLPSLNQHAPTPQTSAPTDQLTSPMSDVDPLWWMHTSVLSLPQHLGALPDLFEGWPSIDGFGQDAFAGGGEAADGAVEGDGAMFDLRSFLEGPSSGDL
ncbi:hypothetical protein OF846_000631 [Rhodotorula toruloides]|nr:hypothetical protein OF846_000631 [Rhodotorula toruloides]